MERAKTLRYAHRVAQTGVHLLETSEVQTHLPTLNEKFGRSFIPELIESKTGAEFGAFSAVDVAFPPRRLAER